jgi:hypothetical protein
MTAQWNDIPAPTGKEAPSRLYPAGYRTDAIDVLVEGNNGQLEYMIRMKAGETMVYSWAVLNISNPQSFYTEFHGHTEATPDRPGDLMFYEKASGSTASGSLVAPWQGIHGWYWQNKSDAPVVVRLRMAGFYELIPGQAGQPVTSMAGETHAP